MVGAPEKALTLSSRLGRTLAIESKGSCTNYKGNITANKSQGYQREELGAETGGEPGGDGGWGRGGEVAGQQVVKSRSADFC